MRTLADKRGDRVAAVGLAIGGIFGMAGSFVTQAHLRQLFWMLDRVAEGVGIRVIKTAVRAPDVNAVAERFVGSARREILDHVIVLDDRHLGRLVAQYKEYFNEARPHQGIGQRIPGKPAVAIDITKPIVTKPVLGGLHHDYRRAA